MNRVGLFYLVAVAAAYLLLARRDRTRTRLSLQTSGQTLWRMLPLLAAIFALIGLFEEFVPPQVIERWLGATSGGLALVAAGLLGAVAIGPPVAAFPIAGSLLDAGAWPPAVATFIVAWVSVGVFTLPVEAEVFGWRYALARNLLTFAAALVIGFAVGVLV